MDLVSLKYFSAAISIVLTLIGTVIPIFVRTETWSERLESLAAGVFIGVGLTHLLGEAISDVAEAFESDYPIAGAITVCMFSLLTAVSLFTYSESDALHHHEQAQRHDDGMDEMDDRDADEHTSLFAQDAHCLPVPTVSLYFIISVHAFIEGLALGIVSEWRSVVAVLCAIAGHKTVEAFALGLILLQGRPTLWMYWLMMIGSALLSPLAIIMSIHLVPSVSPATHGIIAALSAGTFLFVGCEEWCCMFMSKARWSTKERLWHFGLFAVGAAWMLLLALIPEPEEE
jgi:zinc transporter 1/2/3